MDCLDRCVCVPIEARKEVVVEDSDGPQGRFGCLVAVSVMDLENVTLEHVVSCKSEVDLDCRMSSLLLIAVEVSNCTQPELVRRKSHTRPEWPR